MLPIKIAFATEKYNHTYDTLYIFIEECLERNWEVYWFVFEDVYKKDGNIYADLRRVRKHHLGLTPKRMITYEEKITAPLELMDIIFLKRDPPLHKRALMLMKELSGHVLMVNDPHGIIKYESKASFLKFRKFMPPTFFSEHIGDLTRIIKKLRSCVVKEDRSHGGYGVHHVYMERNDFFVDNAKVKHKRINLNRFLKNVTKHGTEGVSVAKYLSKVTEGDKRIIVLDNHVLASILRKPGTKNSWICNIKSGGIAEKSGLSRNERVIIHSIAPKLVKDKVYLSGFDTLADDTGKRVLSEINTTNVGAFRTIERLYRKKVRKYVIDWVEKKLKKYEPRGQ